MKIQRISGERSEYPIAIRVSKLPKRSALVGGNLFISADECPTKPGRQRR